MTQTVAASNCQKCRAPVADRKDLQACPHCGRHVCRRCLAIEPKYQTSLCQDCLRVERAKSKALDYSRRHWRRAACFLAILGLGLYLLSSVFPAGLAVTGLGVLGFGWHLVGYPACPICGGKGVSLRGFFGARQYRCRLCTHEWEL